MNCSTTESTVIESPRVSYIISSGNETLNRIRSLCGSSHPLSSSSNKKFNKIVKPIVYFLLFLIFLSIIALIHTCWMYHSNRNGWDSIKMGLLQPVLLEQVKILMSTANRSIHDPNARQFLRNLSKQDAATCYSPNCLHTSLTLLESMNFSVNPCDNFYEFSCGSWTHSSGEKHPSTPSGVLINSDQFSKINDKVIKATQKILENSATDSELKSFSQAQELYHQCKDLEQLEKDGLDPLWSLLDEYGGWPILGNNINWNNTFDWIRLSGDLQRLSSPAVLAIEIKQHPTNSSTNIIYVVHPKFFLSQEYLISLEKYPKIIAAYREFMTGMTLEFIKYNGALLVDEELLAIEIEEIIKFESALATLASKDDDPTGKLFSRLKAQYTIQKLQKETDLMTPKSPRHSNKIDWLIFFERAFITSDLNVEEEEKLIVHELKYIRGLSPLLSKTSPRILNNYLVWRLLAKFTTGTTSVLRELNFKFFSVVFGMQQIPPRSSTCASVVKDAFALAIGIKIVKGITDLSAKKEVEELVENVRLSMENLLDNQEFAPMLLLVGISKKLNTLKQCIGYPAYFQNSTAINTFYDTLNFNYEEETVYLKKYIKLRYWLFDKIATSLRLPFDSDCWSGISLANIGEAYAYYDSARNSINFPVGLLQSPFYRNNVPLAINYGAIGAIIGHEISHSINFEGWIKIGIVQELQQYWECLLRHYSSYSVPELGPNSRVNGLRTRSENLADHIGVAASYWAYQHLSHQDKITRHHQSHKRLVGLEFFSSSQLYFLSFSHMWCVSGPEEWLADELESSTHTPGRYRVLGTLQNSEDFAKAWSCPSGSKMNPVDKCNSLKTSAPFTKDSSPISNN